MKYRHINKLGIELSAFGLGCMRFPMVEDAEGKSVVDYEKAQEIIRHAIDGGVNYVDTAYVYSEGQNESVVGKALSDGYREKVYIATKLPPPKCETREDMYKIFEEQRAALRTDYIDFYLVHALNRERWDHMRALGVREFLDELKAKGLIKYACFSFHDDYDAFEYILGDYDWDMCQIQFNILDINNQAGLRGLKLAGSKNIPVVIMEGLLGGKLANVPSNVQAVYDSYPEKRSAVEWAFKWLCDFPEIATVLSGVTDISMTDDNLRIFDNAEIGAMTEAEKAIVDKAREEYMSRIKVGCTACRYCMPCPAGVDIPRIFGVWNDSYRFENPAGGRRRYARILEDGVGVDKCVECGACVSVCPQSINIPKMLRVAAEELK